MKHRPSLLSVNTSLPAGKSMQRRGFTLVELLVVLSIMSILAVMTTWSISGVGGAGNENKAILTIGGFMDQCRQYAIANNTYVYIGISQTATPATAASEVWLAAVASSDGTDISSGGQNNVSIGANAFAISKVIKLVGVDVQNASQVGANGWATPWTAPTGAVDIGQAGTKTIGPLGSTNAQFPMAFAFAPDGSVSTNGSVATCLTLGIEVTAGSNASHHVNPAVFQIAGLTGTTKVFRQ